MDGKASGLRLSCSKMGALWIGSNARLDVKICRERNIKWPTEEVKTLGVMPSTNPGTTCSFIFVHPEYVKQARRNYGWGHIRSKVPPTLQLNRNYRDRYL